MKQNRLCYISRNYYNLTSAGNKAKTDNEDTLDEMGAVNLGLHRTVRNSKIIAFFLDLAGILRACLLLQKGDTLFLQYPVKKYFSFLCKVAGLKGAKTVSLIHDLGSFRRKKLTVEKEINRLSHSDYIIASNENMEGMAQGARNEKKRGCSRIVRLSLCISMSGKSVRQATAKSSLCRRSKHEEEFISR